MSRPAVTVIVPFAGSEAELAATVAGLRELSLGSEDQVLIADNRPGAVARVQLGVERVPADGVPAPGYARNRAAALARGEWLVFLDADARPAADLLPAYFTPAPGAGTAVLAGGIEDRAGGPGRASRHSAARGQMRHFVTVQRAGMPYAQTANCAVRAAAFAAVGGFDASARYGEDADLCFRLWAAGWGLEVREAALAVHLSRPSLPALLRQLAGHGTGAAWLERRHPGQFPDPGPWALLTRCARDLARLAQGEGAAGIDALEALAFAWGRRCSNRPGAGLRWGS